MSITNTRELLDFCKTADAFVSWLYYTIGPIIYFGGLISNMVIILIFRYPNFLKSSTEFHFFVLAISDSVALNVGLGFQCFHYTFDFRLQNTSDAICKFQGFAFYTFFDFSSWILVSITLERVCRVRMPLKTLGLFTVKRAKIRILIIFVFFSGINMHFFFTIGLTKEENITNECTYLTESSKYFNDYIFLWIDLILFSFLPFIIMATSNCLIISSLRRSFRASNLNYENVFYDAKNTNVDDLDVRTVHTMMSDDENRSQQTTINIPAEPRQLTLAVGQHPDASRQNLDNPKVILNNPRLKLCNPGVKCLQPVSTNDQSSCATSVINKGRKLATNKSVVDRDNQLPEVKISGSESIPVELQSSLPVLQNANTRHQPSESNTNVVNVQTVSLTDHCSPKDIINKTCQSEVTVPKHGMETRGVMIDTHHKEINTLILDMQSDDRTNNISRNELNCLNPDMKLVNVSSNICLAEITNENPFSDLVNLTRSDNQIKVNCGNSDPKSVQVTDNMSRSEVSSLSLEIEATNTANRDVINPSYPYTPVDAMANKSIRSDGPIPSNLYSRWASNAVTSARRLSLRSSPIIHIVILATLVFLVTTMPFSIYIAVDSFMIKESDRCARSSSVRRMIKNPLSILMYVNCGVNLYLYLARSQHYRKQVIVLLTWNICRRSPSRQTSISSNKDSVYTLNNFDF